jgi:hypothetical protein
MWFLERWLENKKTVKKLVYVLYASLIISCLLGFVIHFAPPAEHVEHGEHAEHVPFVFEQIPIFSATFGFIVCVLLGLGSKAYGHNVVMKEEDYYDE